MIVATPEELELDLAQLFTATGAEPIVTGVGGTNVIRVLRDLPRDAGIYNVGYAGSLYYPVGSVRQIGFSRLFHPNVEFKEQTFRLVGPAEDLCLTSGDFVISPEGLPEKAIVDMELAYICALGFEAVCSFKYISDNLRLEQYEQNSRMSSLIPSAEGSPAAGSGPALTTGAGRGEH